jgi:phage shock protein A
MAASILGRVGQLVRANVNAMLDQAEDPELMLDQLIRDFTDNISDAEQAVAQTVGNLRLVEDDHREAVQAAQEWGDKARAAAQKADQLRTSGAQATEADRFEELAKVALRRQISFEGTAKNLNEQIVQQTALTEQLKDGLNKLRIKREDLVQKRDELVSRAKMAQAQTQVQQAVRDVSVMDPSSELNRFEERIRREEAMARGMAEVSASSLEEQFSELEGSDDELEVESRLAALRGGSASSDTSTPQAASGATSGGGDGSW